MKPENTRTFRTAWLGASETDKTYTNKRKVEFTLESTVPMILLNPELLVNNLINTKVTPVPSVIKNTLVDDTDPLRYTYITTTESVITHNIVRLYHDAMFNDIIIVPDLNNFGTSAITDPNAGMRFELRCRRIAGGDILANEIYEGSISHNSDFKIPKPITTVPSTHYSLKLNTISPNYGNRNGFYDIGSISGSYNFSDSRQLPTGVLNLGTTSGLFGSDIPLPLYQVYRSDMENYKLKNVNIHPIPQFYVILDF